MVMVMMVKMELTMMEMEIRIEHKLYQMGPGAECYAQDGGNIDQQLFQKIRAETEKERKQPWKWKR
jgi:hypothetical protein